MALDEIIYFFDHTSFFPTYSSAKMLSLFSSRKPAAAPTTVPTDTVIPLNAADDTDVLRSVFVVLSYRFDDVLDPE